MRCPTIEQLPQPRTDKTGWPWTEQSAQVSDLMPDGMPWPLISVVTPSFNQNRYLEETIRSILLQGYPNIELLIIDGGSTDGSIDLIRGYEPWISYWVSEKDRGQSHAVNKGFQRATGALVAWQNSDDIFDHDCFASAARARVANPNVSVFYGQVPCIDAYSRVIRENRAREFQLEDGIPWFDLANQCLFFGREIFDAGLFLDESFHHCMDAEFYWRLIFAGHKFLYVPEMAGAFRIHGEAKTAKQQHVNRSDALRVFESILNWSGLPEAVRGVAVERLAALACTAYDAYDDGGETSFDCAVALLDRHAPDAERPLGLRARQFARVFGYVGKGAIKVGKKLSRS